MSHKEWIVSTYNPPHPYGTPCNCKSWNFFAYRPLSVVVAKSRFKNDILRTFSIVFIFLSTANARSLKFAKKTWFHEKIVTKLTSASLFINKRFLLNKMFQQNASKFAIFYVYFMYKKPHVVFFVFHFMQLYIFTLWMVDQGIHKVKM